MVPSELKQLPQWIVWRLEERKGKPTKVPYRADGTGMAAVDAPPTWATARAAYDRWKMGNGHGDYGGVGFVVTAADPYCGIDLDHCFDKTKGEITPWAQKIVDRFASYTEVTPSETGLRIWIKGKLPGDRNRTGDIELYDNERYFTTTGWRLESAPQEIHERQVELDAFYQELFPPQEPRVRALGSASLTPYAVEHKAREAKNGAKFERLMRGDTSEYSSESEADLGLASLAAFWTDDAGVIEQIIRSSGLWDEKWERQDYRERTIRKAIEERSQSYSGSLPNGQVGPVASEQSTVTVTPVKQAVPWPEPLGEAAYHGLAGRLTGLIKPYVESNEASVLVQFLAAFGVAVGLRPHLMVSATRHAPATYVGLVGPTSMGRKGTAWDPVETLFRLADGDFIRRVMSGIGSGERLVWLVRDPVLDSKGIQTDEGAKDRRLLLQEPELARLLTVVNREGSTLSPYLRQAYDGKALRNEVKTQGSVASLHHIGMIGHSTIEELRSQLTEQQVRNGLANRLIWVLAKREKKLDDPPVFEGRDVEEAASELAGQLAVARTIQRLNRSPEAKALWREWYMGLADESSGITGAITARAAAQVARFSMIYALTDGLELVGLEHMQAAMALWDYSVRCVRHIWGSSSGDLIADRIFEELAWGPLTMTQIYREVFSGNVSGPILERAVQLLESRGLVIRERISSAGPGRPALRVRRLG